MKAQVHGLQAGIKAVRLVLLQHQPAVPHRGVLSLPPLQKHDLIEVSAPCELWASLEDSTLFQVSRIRRPTRDPVPSYLALFCGWRLARIQHVLLVDSNSENFWCESHFITAKKITLRKLQKWDLYAALHSRVGNAG